MNLDYFINELPILAINHRAWLKEERKKRLTLMACAYGGGTIKLRLILIES